MCLDMTIIVCLVQNKKMPFKSEKSIYNPTRFNPTFHNLALFSSAIEKKLDKLEKKLDDHIEEIWTVYKPIKELLKKLERFKLW